LIEAVHQILLAHAWAGLLIVALMAWLEYVFPPVPGDSTMLLACFLAGAGALPIAATIAACFGGSTLGAVTSYAIGARLGRSYFFLRSEWARDELRRFERGLERFGPPLLVVNRFLPGVRAVFLYGAGIGRLPPRPALAYATVSNALWVGFIAWAGSALGSSWEEVQVVFRRYVYAIAIGMTAYIAWRVLRARRRRRPPS
jgi:membrane protein DedA with SNARE-associated domain